MNSEFNRTQRRQIEKSGLDVKFMQSLVMENVEKLSKARTDQMVDYFTAAVALTLRDKLGFGHARLTRTMAQIEEVFLAVQEGYISFDEIKEALKNEVDF